MILLIKQRYLSHMAYLKSNVDFWFHAFLMQWISSIFWKCYKLNSSISQKCWKFIASKMLEIESQHLTWVGPKCMYLSSRSRNLSIACKMATCWKIAFFIYMYVCPICTYLGYGQGQATRVWRKKMHSDHWNFWMGLYFWNAIF